MGRMISIKKLIEQAGAEALQATLDSYRSVLAAIGDSAAQACPQVGNTMRQNLLNLQAVLSPESTPDLLHQTGQQAEAEITQWGSSAADYFRQRAGEAKELMMILANAAELAGERDQRYHRQVHEFTGRLQAIADLDDLRLIRDSLVKSAIDLRACAEAMADESQKAVARLRADVKAYQTRLDDAERLAGQDPLTGLDNRRRVEAAIEYRLERQQPFSILLLDLNGFKELNDSCGHLAGDELLKLFSAELKSAFRASDIVGRSGGDEFIIVLDTGIEEVHAHMERISRWVLGDYTVRAGDSSRKVTVSAAMGTAAWQPGDSLRTLLERADAAMYRAKRAQKQS